jgi:putative transcription factor
MNCDMCGKEGKLVEAIVEGVLLNVCETCVKYGKVIPLKKPDVEVKFAEKKDRFKKKIVTPEVFEIIVDNFSEKVKKSREAKGLKQEELAKQIAEKESVIHNIESGHLKPGLKLAKKLEVFLGIKLIEKTEEKIKREINFKDNNLTVGDLLRTKK